MKKLLILPIILISFLAKGQLTYSEIQTYFDGNYIDNIAGSVSGGDLNTGVSYLNQSIGLYHYDATRVTYKQDSSGVIYDGRLWLNSTSITSPEAWNSAKWTKLILWGATSDYMTADTNVNLATNEGLFFGGNKYLHIADDVNSVFFGNAAGAGITTGVRNTGMGFNALETNTGGTDHTVVGYKAGEATTGTTDNTFIGGNSGWQNQTGSQNTFLGAKTGFTGTSGSSNTYLGYQSGYSNVSGANNICIGSGAGYFETGSNMLYIEPSTSVDPLIEGDFAKDSITINGALQVSGYGYFGAKPSTTESGINMTNDTYISWFDAAGADAINVLTADGGDTIKLFDNYKTTTNEITITEDSIQIIGQGDTLTIWNNGSDKWTIGSTGDTIQIGENSLKVIPSGNVEIDGDLTITGDFIQADPPHSKLVYKDSTVTISAGTNIQITNSYDSLYRVLEEEGVTYLSGDTIQIDEDGGYNIHLAVRGYGSNGDDFEVTIARKRGGSTTYCTEVIEFTTTGATNKAGGFSTFYEELEEEDKIWPVITSSGELNTTSGSFKVQQYYKEE